jgi:hypothetical protein
MKSNKKCSIYAKNVSENQTTNYTINPEERMLDSVLASVMRYQSELHSMCIKRALKAKKLAREQAK